MGYDRALQLAIFHFHKTSASNARSYLANMITKHDFKNAARVSEIEDELESYIDWATGENLKSAGVQVKMELVWGFLELRGEISRVDVTTSGYRAVLLREPPQDWQEQLRMPLIQAAMSATYARPVQEIEVGFQELNGGNLQMVSYNPRQLKAAQDKFRILGRRIRRLSKSKT